MSDCTKITIRLYKKKQRDAVILSALNKLEDDWGLKSAEIKRVLYYYYKTTHRTNIISAKQKKAASRKSEKEKSPDDSEKIPKNLVGSEAELKMVGTSSIGETIV